MNIISAYFSPSEKTKEIVLEISKNIGNIEREINLLKESPDLIINENQLFVIGLPNFCGRIPPYASERLKKIKGKNAKAVAINVYGNCGVYDALIETYDILKDNGFTILSAGSFIAQHSIFTNVASTRPDKSDLLKMKEFCNLTLKKIENNIQNEVQVLGKRPYRKYVELPFYARANDKCNQCKLCADVCPTNAINKETPNITDSKKCISCTACINICPQNARSFGSIKTIASPFFKLLCTKRQEPKWYL